MKKIIIGFLILAVIGMLLPSISYAMAGTYMATSSTEGSKKVCYEGLVPCGKEVYIGGEIDEDGNCTGGESKVIHCQLCHFFVLINKIINFTLIYIIPPLAVLMIVIGGGMFYFAGAKPSLKKQGQSLIKGVMIGLFLIYGAYMIVGLFLSVLGVASASPLGQWGSSGAFSIDCPVKLPQ